MPEFVGLIQRLAVASNQAAFHSLHELKRLRTLAFVDWLRNVLKRSSRVHLRSDIATVADAVRVIDRFIDGTPAYELEWDDFISWENFAAGVERLRNEIAAMEPMFFSTEKDVKLKACKELVAIRNRYAALVGIAERGEFEQT
jgi:hypothetical protein